MPKITYSLITLRSHAVFLEGKRVGTIIHSLDNMWSYCPYGEMEEGGEKFPTLELCKQSLESD